jgi:hypothetical protein
MMSKDGDSMKLIYGHYVTRDQAKSTKQSIF